MKTKMQPELVTITPQIAAEWLKYNTGNRKLPVGNSKHYAKLLESGEFMLTHQAMAFTGTRTEPGRLLDGQTRLTAVIETGISMMQWVFWGCDDQTFAVLDGGKQRSFSDHHGWDKQKISFVNILHWVSSGMKIAKITKTEADSIWESYGRQFGILMDACPSQRKKISCAAVRAGVCVAMKQNPSRENEIAGFYRAMVLENFSDLPAGICRLFIKLNDVVGGGRDAITYQMPLTTKVMTPKQWEIAVIYPPSDDAKKDLFAYVSSSITK